MHNATLLSVKSSLAILSLGRERVVDLLIMFYLVYITCKISCVLMSPSLGDMGWCVVWALSYLPIFNTLMFLICL